MKKVLAVITAAALGAGGLTVNDVYQTNAELEQQLYEQTELLNAFSRFGQDIHNGQWFKNGRGQYFVEFDYMGSGSDSLNHHVGRWERVVEDRYGSTPGTITIQGQSYSFDADGNVTGSTHTGPGYEIYALANEVRVWISDQPTELLFTAQDSLWNVSGEQRVRFDPCGEFTPVCDSLMAPPVFDDWTLYFSRIERADSTGTFRRFMQTNIESDVRGLATMRQGQYRIWFCMVDPKGMPGHFIGPVRVMAGELCP
jgi:hypothetical protein